MTNAAVDQSEVTEGCAGGTTGRTLLRFGTKVTTLGPDTLLIGNPGCPDCTNPANNGVSCQDPRFECDAAIWGGVAHFRSAALFELLDPSGQDVVVGSKRGYCFNDDECSAGVTPQFTSCGYQGLTVGCTDVYESYFYCQYLDLTDVPNATTRAFTLRVTIDSLNLLPDPNRANNVTEVAIPGCGDGIVQPGEACDDGPVNGTPASCCTATCQFAAAGTACSGGVCDGMDHCEPMTTSTSSSTSTTHSTSTSSSTTTSSSTSSTTSTPTSSTTTTTLCVLDVDANGVVDVPTDITYIARHLLGLRTVPPSYGLSDTVNATIAANIDALCH